LEEYLIQEKNFKNRQLIAKFRTSDHCLQIETGRYNNIPRQQRLCTTCNILEDEYHFFLNCHLNQQPRNLLINTIENKYPSFTNMSPMNRLDYILNPTSDLLSLVCTFINQSLELRDRVHTGQIFLLYLHIYYVCVVFLLYVCMLLYCNCLTHMGVICNLNK
jgi:hypothetical protein